MYRPSATLFWGLYLMASLTWADLGDAAYGAGTAIGSAIQAAGGFYCDMIRRYPNWSLQNPLGLDPISRAINDKLCGSSPALPAPDNPAIPGGKCECVEYTVNFTYRLRGTGTLTGNYVVKGPISPPRWFTNTSNLLVYGFTAFDFTCTVRGAYNVVSNVTQADLDDGTVFARIDSIVRNDGAPDTCGGQPPTYNPKTPTLPDVNRTAPIILAPGITVVTPIIIVRPTVDITLAPRTNINFSPTFNLPDIGISIKFDVAGVEINNSVNFGYDLPSTGPDPRNPPPLLPPSIDFDTDLSVVYERLRNLTELSEDIKDCACATDPPLTAVNIGTANSGNVVLPPNTRFVVTTVTAFPSSYKFQSGINAADVLYAGWAWTQYPGTALGLRDPVDSVRKCFFVEKGAQRFQWTLYVGFILQVTAYYEA